jgi:hypothetical protein
MSASLHKARAEQAQRARRADMSATQRRRPDTCKGNNDAMQTTAITIGKVGYYAGLAAFVSTTAYCVVQILQLAGVLRPPFDEILIYATSLCIVVPLLLEILALHHLTERDKQFWTHASLIFTVIYAVFVTANYIVQLATVIPAKSRGAVEAIRILEQTPHSLFWDFDALGYICMGLATLVAIPALNDTGFDRWVRWSFIANALVTPLISIVYFYPTYSERLLFLGFPWAITAPLFMLLLAIMLRRHDSVPVRPLTRGERCNSTAVRSWRQQHGRTEASPRHLG